MKRNLGVFASQNNVNSYNNHLVEKNMNSSGFSNDIRNEEKKNNNHSLNYGHNPLINPTPFTIQNPYLRKEYLKYLGAN